MNAVTRKSKKKCHPFTQQTPPTPKPQPQPFLPLSPSKKFLQALERYRKTGAALKCKTCTADQEEKERATAAAAASSARSDETTTTTTTHKCASCKETLPTSLFNRNQLSKKKEKARCRACVEKALKEEEQSKQSSRQNQIDEIQAKLKELDVKKGGSGSANAVQEKLKYESMLSALEAEHVTGLKPMKMRSAGRGRGGSWRTRTGSGAGRGGGRGGLGRGGNASRGGK